MSRSSLGHPPPILDDQGPQIDSENGKFIAVPGPDARTTVIYRVSAGKRTEVWRAAGWANHAYLSNDGEHLVRAYEGRQHLALNYKPETPMLLFYARDRLVGVVALRQVIRDFKSMPRMHTHYIWGYYTGFVAAHRFAIDTIDRRRIVYDVTTGQVVEDVASPLDWRNDPPSRKSSSPPSRRRIHCSVKDSRGSEASAPRLPDRR